MTRHCQGVRPPSVIARAGRTAGTKPSRTLDRYAGTYADSLWGPIAVKYEGGGLTMQMGEGLTADLEHWHYDSFIPRWRSPRHREDWLTLATFSLDDTGIQRA